MTTAQAVEQEIIHQYRQGMTHWPTFNHAENIDIPPLAPLTEAVIHPDDNPFSIAKHTLGKQLFFERRLSQSQQIACASCHDPDLGWADGRRKAIGHNRIQGDMNSPSVVNSGYLQQLFWDGRANSLEQQILASWTNPVEMAADSELASQRIADVSGYPPLFEQAFGDNHVSPERITQAIAVFLRSLTSYPSQFDAFLAGEQQALNDQQIRGLHLFRTKARCILCHHGPLLTDQAFHHLGTSFHNTGNFLGRYRVTGQTADVGAFRTPSLRTGLTTPPYMHNGFVTDLDTLLALYNLGWWQNAELENKGNTIPTATLSPLIQPLALTDDEIADLKAFLFSLESHLPQMLLPDELP